ncbi:hypothetical protein D3C78_1026030 [compost metagenome]
METRQRMLRMQLPGNRPQQLAVAIGAARPVFGLQHLALGLQARVRQQRPGQQVDQAQQRRTQLARRHLQVVEGLQAEGAGVVAPAVAVHVVGEGADFGKAAAAEKQAVFEEMCQSRPLRRLVEAANRDADRQGHASGLRVVQHGGRHAVAQSQAAMRQLREVGVHGPELVRRMESAASRLARRRTTLRRSQAVATKVLPADAKKARHRCSAFFACSGQPRAGRAGYCCTPWAPGSGRRFTSTRRFCWRPDSLALLATGWSGPAPRVVTRLGLTPWEIR